MNVEPISENRAEDPSSERWLQYYRDARRRRHARPTQESTRALARKYRNRQTAMLASGFVVVGVLVSIFYFVLMHQL